MKSILDPAFKYTPAAKTDVRKTFRRVRREMREKNLQERRTFVGSIDDATGVVVPFHGRPEPEAA